MKRRDFVRAMTAAGTGLLFSRPRFARAADSNTVHPGVKRVLVMFKCHFDAGFIDTQANVVHKYFTEYFPRAIETAKAANAGGKRRYVWTTGSWLLFEYLEQASAADRKIMEEAIERRDIAWHALPFTWQSEMLSPSMIEGSLAISQSLDRRYGRTTSGAKMTDVPGHTRGIVQPLAKHGIAFLEIGVNGGSTPAELPPIFLWKDPSGASLPMMYHHQYGGVAIVPGSDLALVTAVRNDNSGPDTPDEIAQAHADLAAQFPNAEIVATNLSDMANALAPYRAGLPVVEQEIGDTWIYGVASDPLKVARYRALARLRDEWIATGKLKIGDETDLKLLRHVLLEAEHTWGADTKTWLDFDNYIPADLSKMLDTKNYKVVQFSWAEKRNDLLAGIATLPPELRAEADHALEGIKPAKPTLPITSQPAGKPIETAQFHIVIDPHTGAITRLANKATGREWAGAANPIALLTYQTLSEDDYERFIRAYVTTKADWAQKDFGKPNIERYGAKSQEWRPSSAEVRVEETLDGQRIVILPRFEDDDAFRRGRAAFPRKVFVEMYLPKASPQAHITVSCFDKPATRMPESLWLSFNPIAKDRKMWTFEKSGQAIAPFDVVASGNRHMHCLQKGFKYQKGGDRFAVDTLDAPVVALGERTPLLFSNDQPDLDKGVHSCLFNNAWGTNYIMWYGEDIKARFVLSV